MKKILLTQGKFAIVDDDDYPFLSRLEWSAQWEAKRDTYYAVTSVHIGGRSSTIGMHRMMLGFPILEIDHRDGDGLNNVRSNLRKATRVQNAQNARKCVSPKSSKFKGVSRTPWAWVATIGQNGKSVHLGSFRTENEAAQAYNSAAIKKFGPFAKLNNL